MHRFFLPPDRCQGPVLTLGDSDSHHAARVLRLGLGERIEVLDGAGRRFDCEIVHPDRRATGVRILAETRQPAPPEVRLAVAVLKGRAMEVLVQKATELGATALHPLFTERTIPRLGKDDPETWAEAWRTTAVEASKQCGNAWLPHIHPPVDLARWLSARPADDGPLLAAMLRPHTRSPRAALAGGLAAASAPVTVVIGPEGDFTDREQEALLAAGALPITLGPLTLRADTAAIAALAVIQHERASTP